jgi:hypothetical protein
MMGTGDLCNMGRLEKHRGRGAGSRQQLLAGNSLSLNGHHGGTLIVVDSKSLAISMSSGLGRPGRQTPGNYSDKTLNSHLPGNVCPLPCKTTIQDFNTTLMRKTL